jgi:hypothetical protein
MTVDFAKLQEIFLAAVERHRPEDWDAYVNQACADDDELRRQVNLLLQAHHEAGSVPGAAASEPDQTGAYQTAAEAPGGLIGPYKLLEQIGEGGMGTVWLAEQKEPIQRRVAVKVIKAGMDSKQVLARFEAERQALAIMYPVNIARVFDGGTTGGDPGGVSAGRPYFVSAAARGSGIAPSPLLQWGSFLPKKIDPARLMGARRASIPLGGVHGRRRQGLGLAPGVLPRLPAVAGTDAHEPAAPGAARPVGRGPADIAQGPREDQPVPRPE